MEWSRSCADTTIPSCVRMGTQAPRPVRSPVWLGGMGTQLQAPSVVTDLLGTMLEGRYRVHNLIAVGGMSIVFRGHHLRLKRDVAIKVLDPALGPGSSTRFLREAESAAQLDHPNCITVHDFGVSSNGLSFMVIAVLLMSPLATDGSH